MKNRFMEFTGHLSDFYVNEGAKFPHFSINDYDHSI